MAFVLGWRPKTVGRSWRAGVPKGALDSLPDQLRHPALTDGEGGGRSQRFRPASRLRRKSEFSRVFRRNTRSADRYFTVLARPLDRGLARLGMAISVRAAGGAVARNRLKRLVREYFRCNRQLLPAVDIVIMSRPEAGAADQLRLRQSLCNHWQRIAAQCKTSPSS